LIVLWLQAPCRIHAGELFGSAADHLRLTEYDDVHPIVKIQAARIFEDHERFGFFRLGLAPFAVIQSVQIQIESADRLTNALASLNSWKLSSGELRRLEIRDLEISLFGEKQPRLHAATARPNTTGALELSKVSLTGGPTISISKATLQMTGPAAGRLRWRDGAKEAECPVLKPTENQH
jgi:hypothetical protein